MEAQRPDFHAPQIGEGGFKVVGSKTPDPNWKPGQGLSSASSSTSEEWRAFSATNRAPYKVFDMRSGSEERSLAYRLLIGGVVPRPIAFCSTVGEGGRENLAPMSFFNVVGFDPPTLVVSFTTTAKNDTYPTSQKHTLANLIHSRECTVSIISLPFVEAANYTSIDAPPDVSEWKLPGLTPAPSEMVKAPGVAESAFWMECVYDSKHEIVNEEGKCTATAAFLRVKKFHIRSDLLVDGGKRGVDIAKLLPVARLGGIGWGSTGRWFETPRPRWEEEKERVEVGFLSSL
ncbi:hypothetical protein BT69DRAFT_1269560 [Atractiella rhizophila]|nr:hypothetical protein BT69DRAFT_1269560 [Atractiella rhizophila]